MQSQHPYVSAAVGIVAENRRCLIICMSRLSMLPTLQCPFINRILRLPCFWNIPKVRQEFHFPPCHEMVRMQGSLSVKFAGMSMDPLAYALVIGIWYKCWDIWEHQAHTRKTTIDNRSQRGHPPSRVQLIQRSRSASTCIKQRRDKVRLQFH